jgi:uncharacterized repeat protein (TIGR01451 family)
VLLVAHRRAEQLAGPGYGGTVEALRPFAFPGCHRPQKLRFSSGTIGGITSTSSASDLTSQVAPVPTDLQITGFASTGSPTVGSTFTFQVKDNGLQPAPGVSFADVFPVGETFVSASTNLAGQTCGLAVGQVSCSLGDLAVGAQANVTLTVSAPSAPTTITVTATVSMTVTDLKPSNNSVAVTLQVK